MAKTDFKDIAEHINSFPKERRGLLEKLRKTIREAAPDATETIGYGIPTFKLNGKNLVHFAGFKNHIGFFPDPRGIEAFEKDLAKYRTGKGTLQFPYDKPVPWDLVTKIVKFRVNETLPNKK